MDETSMPLIGKKEAVRLIIPKEKPINPKASQSNRLVLRRSSFSTHCAKCLAENPRFRRQFRHSFRIVQPKPGHDSLPLMPILAGCNPLRATRSFSRRTNDPPVPRSAELFPRRSHRSSGVRRWDHLTGRRSQRKLTETPAGRRRLPALTAKTTHAARGSHPSQPPAGC